MPSLPHHFFSLCLWAWKDLLNANFNAASSLTFSRSLKSGIKNLPVVRHRCCHDLVDLVLVDFHVASLLLNSSKISCCLTRNWISTKSFQINLNEASISLIKRNLFFSEYLENDSGHKRSIVKRIVLGTNKLFFASANSTWLLFHYQHFVFNSAQVMDNQDLILSKTFLCGVAIGLANLRGLRSCFLNWWLVNCQLIIRHLVNLVNL